MQLKKTLAKISLLKVSLVIFVSIYMFFYIKNIPAWHFIDNINLIFHEAGHIVFFFFGEFMAMIGGTLMQILVPLSLFIYFYIRGNNFSSSLILFWLSQNFFNVYVYARDAIKMELPLLGGDSVYHDWNSILSTLNLLKYTEQIASVIYFIGIIILIFAIVFSLKHSTKEYV